MHKVRFSESAVQRGAYERDGAVLIKGLLNEEQLNLISSGIGYVKFKNTGDWAGKSLFMRTREGELVSCEVVPLPFYDAEKRIPRGLSPSDS